MKNNILKTSLVILMTLVLSFTLVSADPCTLKGYTKDSSGTEIGNITVHINVENPDGSYETVSDDETFIGYYSKGFSCSQGSSIYNVIAYNSTHYGEATTTADSDEVTFLNVNLTSQWPEDSYPPKYYNDKDNSHEIDGIKRVVEGTKLKTSVLWIDNSSNLGRINVYSNKSGSMELFSFCDVTNTNVSWCNRSIYTSGKAGETICWKQEGKDIRDNLNNTMPEHCFYVDEAFNENSVKLNYPKDYSEGINKNTELSVVVTNPINENMDVSFYNLNGNLIKSINNVTNGTNITVSWNDLEPRTTYDWYVNLSDKYKTGSSEIWTFTTKFWEEDEYEDSDRDRKSSFNIDKEELDKGFKKKFLKGDKVLFQINDEEYSSKINDIQKDSVEVFVENELLEMKSNDSRKLDLDKNGFYDLMISSGNIDFENLIKNVELEYKSINEEIPSEEEPGQEEEVKDTGEEEISEKSYWYLYLIGGIIIIGLIVWFVYKKKK